MAIEIYEIGKILKIDYDLRITDKKLKFTLFPYKGSDIINTCLLFILSFSLLGIFANLIFNVEILMITFIFFGFVIAAILYIYPTQIHYTNMIMGYKKEMLNTIMRFSMYLTMKSNLEYALYNSLEHMDGILKVQFQEILLKLERKDYISLGEGFKDYSQIWNQYSPEFVDSLKLLEVAALSSEKEAQEIMEQSVEQIILSYNIEQKRSSEELSLKIGKVILAGIMLPVMILMLVPLISVFMPDTIKASILFLGFNVLIPAFLLTSGLKFSAYRLQLSNIKIDLDPEYKIIPPWVYTIAFAIFLIFAIPSFYYMIQNPPGEVDFDSFGLETIFFVWLIPTGISLAIYFITFYYVFKNQKIYDKHRAVEDDIPHLLNYFNTYLSLSVPMENIFKEITEDYKQHGFKNHPSVSLLDTFSFKLSNLKTNLNSFIKFDLKKFSPVRTFNEVIEQINSFAEFSLKEAAKVSKKIREQKVNIIKLNDYILTLLNNTITFVYSTMLMLAPLLSSMAIIMSLFVVKFIQFMSEQLETIANLGTTAGQRITIDLVDVTKIISPVYLELIIGFYVIQIILILALIKSNMQYGYSSFNIIKSIKQAQMGYVIFSICLFGGYFVFKTMFASAIGIDM